MSQYQLKTDSWLFFLRISIPLLAIIQILSFYNDLPLFFSDDAYILPDIMNDALTKGGLSIYDINNVLKQWGIDIDYYSLVRWVVVVYFFFLILLLLGFLSRISAIISTCFHLVLLQSMHHFIYGVDYFTTMLLFYCIICPVSQFHSIDNYLFKNKFVALRKYVDSLNIDNLLWLRIMQAHICIAYFFSGFEKLLGFNWRNGESIWKTVHNFNGIIDYEVFDKWATTPLFIILAWTTMILEMGYPLMINLKKTRLFWLVGIIGMHLSIVIILGLFQFSAIMLVFNLVTYGIPYTYSFKLTNFRETFKTVYKKIPAVKL